MTLPSQTSQLPLSQLVIETARQEEARIGSGAPRSRRGAKSGVGAGATATVGSAGFVASSAKAARGIRLRMRVMAGTNLFIGRPP
jgi:hypothetical protein